MDIDNGIYTLSFEDGSEQEAEYLHHLEYEGKTYVALNTIVPEDGDEEEALTLIMLLNEDGELDEVIDEALLEILEEKFIKELQEKYGEEFEVV